MADRARAALVALSAVHAKTVADLQVARAASRAAAEERDRALAEKDEALAEVALLAANAGAAVGTTPVRAGFAEAVLPLVAAAVDSAVADAEIAAGKAVGGDRSDETDESKAAEAAYVRRIASAYRKFDPGDSGSVAEEKWEADSSFEDRQRQSRAAMVSDGGASAADVEAVACEIKGVLLSVAQKDS